MQPHLETHMNGAVGSDAERCDVIGEVAELFACRLLGAVPLFAKYTREVSEILWQGSKLTATVKELGVRYPLSLRTSFMSKLMWCYNPDQYLFVVVAAAWNSKATTREEVVANAGIGPIVYVLTLDEMNDLHLKHLQGKQSVISLDDFTIGYEAEVTDILWNNQRVPVLICRSDAARKLLPIKINVIPDHTRSLKR